MKSFGIDVARLFAGARTRAAVFNGLAESCFAAARVSQPSPPTQLYPAIQREKSYLIEVHLGDAPSSSWRTWIAGVSHHSPDSETGAVSCYDLELEPRFHRNTHFETFVLQISKASIDAYLDDAQLPPIHSLRSSGGKPDTVMLHLARLLDNYLTAETKPSELFIRHYLQMICGHLVATYGAMDTSLQIAKGGLAPWQKRRALAILEADLDGDLRLARLSAECGLSSSYFCRCFRTTFGCSVHQFVVKKRIERAQELLLEQKLSLAEIAIGTGFSDQAAFSRTFMSSVGKPPGKWRTEQRVLRQAKNHAPVTMFSGNTVEPEWNEMTPRSVATASLVASRRVAG
ncbi:helix-turn-helix domain-containing protein [Granulicella cerasi]|uniref:Helix-turn-helix domain-containing protein n=1 Tax=Granulicella cerasi TaxID=741063 RepID=A0ABW1Z957_9BACT|nr:AraC family transcriptional regulator [Granulicella cerasi]